MSEEARRLDTLKAERDRFVSLAFCWADLLFELNPQGLVVFAAGATQAFFGRAKEDLAGTNFRNLVATHDLPLFAQILSQVEKAGRVDDQRMRFRGPDDATLWMSLAAYSLDPADGNVFVGLRKSKPITAKPAKSGLHTGSSFAERAAGHLKKIREAGDVAQVTLVAIPGAKDLERRLDSRAAEELDHTVGDMLKASSVGGDSAAKVGAGRYSLLHAADAKIGGLVREIEDLTRQMDPIGQGAPVETATMTMDAETILDDEHLAEGLLYTLNKFRNSDGGSFSIKDLAVNMPSLVNEAVTEISKFKSVVSHAKFGAALQPIVDINSGDIHHYEALCRFDDAPAQSPYKTITFAEETGLIHDFDFAMAKKVVQVLSQASRKCHIAVNVSGYSIGVPAYVDSLIWLLRDNESTRGRLMFEITESSRMSDLDAANSFIQVLRQRGYKVCLDDFGAGAASFQYLSVLDVDMVKLDGSAIRNAQKVPKGRAFLSALTDLCRRMSIETIAEMVDSTQSLAFCRDCGCDYVQGFLFGKPSFEMGDFSPLPQARLFAKRGRVN